MKIENKGTVGRKNGGLTSAVALALSTLARNEGKTKSNVVVPVRRIVGMKRRPTVPGIAVPTSTTNHMEAYVFRLP